MISGGFEGFDGRDPLFSRKLYEFEWSARLEEEDIPVRGNAMVSGDPEEDRRAEEWVLERLERGHLEAWCYVAVGAKATIGPVTFVGRAGLGAASYENERDLWRDLLPDLKQEAFDDLIRAIRIHGGQSPEILVALDQLLEDEAELMELEPS